MKSPDVSMLIIIHIYRKGEVTTNCVQVFLNIERSNGRFTFNENNQNLISVSI